MKLMKYTLIILIIGSSFSFDSQRYNDENNAKYSDINNGEDIPANNDSWLLNEILKLNSSRVGNSSQIILVYNMQIEETEVLVETFERKEGQWVEVFGLMVGTIGRSGFAPYQEKIELDGRTPTGIFLLGPVFSYPGEKVETKMEHWTASENDYWIDDIKSKQYNRWVISDTDPKNDGVSREVMKRGDDLYKFGVTIKYNMDQKLNTDVGKGMGSVIVLHLRDDSGKPTSGCVKVDEAELIDILQWLDPAKKPIIIMGTSDDLSSKKVSGDELNENDNYVWKKEKWIPPAN